MAVGKPFYHCAFLQVPDYDGALLGTRGHVPVAVADGYINNDFLVAVERGLKHEVVFIPDLDDPTTKN